MVTIDLNLIALIICLIGMWINRKDTNGLILNGFLVIVNAILYVS